MKTLLASLLLAGAVYAEDHDERRVPLDEGTIKARKFGVEATMSLKDDGSLGLVIVMNGKPVDIPERALAQINEPRVGTAFFSTETPTGVPVSESKLKGGIILSFRYGDKVTHGFGKGPLDVRSGCRIRISAEGKYDGIETAVPQGEYSNRWRVLAQSKDGTDIRRESVAAAECPLRWIETER